MKRAIKTHFTDFLAILVLLILAAAITGFILVHQGFQFPFLSTTPFHDYVELQTGQAVTPGQGQSVRVSGVQIGDIGDIELKDGYALVRLDIQPKYKNLIHTDATALLRPRTGLDDMFIELNPGRSPSPVAKEGFTINMVNSQPDVDLDEVLSGLDSDSRAYLDQLINGFGGALNHRGSELAQVLDRFEPTHRDLAIVSEAVASRGRDLQQLIHSLAGLNSALAAKQVQIKSLIKTSSVVFAAFASEDGHVSQAVAELPSTLRETTAALLKVRKFANILGPATEHLLPAVNAIPAANQALTNLAVPSTPIVKNQIRPFIRTAQPVLLELQPAASKLAAATPNLSTSFTVINHFFNMLGYEPGGGQHGYLWWLAWADHNARSLFDSQDANGDFRNLFLQLSCASLAQVSSGTGQGALLETVLNTTPILTDAKLCPQQAAASTAAFKQYQAGTLGRKANDTTADEGNYVPFLPKLPGVTK